MQEFLQKVDNCLVDEVRSYAEETGESFQSCIEEAITLWLDCVAGPTLEAFRAPPKHKLSLVPLPK